VKTRARKTYLADLTALAARDEIARGAAKAVEITEACLARIAEREPQVQAWAHLDPGHAMRQAEAADRHRASGRPIGPLHGVPVGVKDIIDTRDFPTENGTPLDAGRRPRQDAAVVQRLREAGAVILGKTVTTELAVYTPGKTRNPHDPSRTPGGSSSGSAAAVAAGMVPLALGSQTNGSVIRPASFCGVVGFKPSRGLVSRRGVLVQSPTLDAIGTFTRTVEDTALLADALAGHDDGDPGSIMAARPNLFGIMSSKPPVRPALALVRSPVWKKAQPEVREGFDELAEAIGDRVDAVDLPEPFGWGHGWHRAIMLADIARSYAPYYDRDPAGLSEKLRGMVEEGLTIKAVDYARALDGIAVLEAGLERLFERYDAIVTPAAPGEAPVGLESTGDPVFSTLWTYCGVPALTLPLLTGPNGMPVGVQLVGRRFYDGRLLRTARWLSERLRDEGQDVRAVMGVVA
jgi:Asp-tRNA(Asn)/Glu-tRNA(Gln) amidotransferase A subunit family amidase